MDANICMYYIYYREHFPFYKLNDGTWKNSVRHTLTVSPHFHKAGKATHRAGHLWSVAKGCESFQETLVRICHILSLLSIYVLKFFMLVGQKSVLKIILALRKNYYTGLIMKCILVQEFVSRTHELFKHTYEL
jgi:hypothetical protein